MPKETKIPTDAAERLDAAVSALRAHPANKRKPMNWSLNPDVTAAQIALEAAAQALEWAARGTIPRTQVLAEVVSRLTPAEAAEVVEKAEAPTTDSLGSTSKEPGRAVPRKQ